MNKYPAFATLHRPFIIEVNCCTEQYTLTKRLGDAVCRTTFNRHIIHYMVNDTWELRVKVFINRELNLDEQEKQKLIERFGPFIWTFGERILRVQNKPTWDHR